MQRPLIKCTPPGPKASAWIDRDHRHTSPSLPREYPLVIAAAEGMWIQDVDGNRFLDFTSGIAVSSTGNCHPKVVEAIRAQAGRLIHTCGADFYHQPMIQLVEKLVAITPGSFDKRVFLGNSGAEAVEAGLKLARWHSGRQKILAFVGAFHGRTLGTLSLNASKAVQTRRFGPLVPGVLHVPYAHCYRCTYNLSFPSCDFACVRYIEEVVFASLAAPDEFAVIVVEPIQGEGGYIVPPPGYHRRLKALAEKHGILYMVDEIQTGMGRTGRMFAIEHDGVEPEILAAAKGIASGMPLSALVAQSAVMDWSRGAHGSTYGGNPVACAASLATIDLLTAGLVENAAWRGEQLQAGLASLQLEHECMGDVRGRGLMQAVELVTERRGKTPDRPLRDRLLRRCFEKGLLLLSCGESTIRFCPPLIVAPAEIDTAIDIFQAVLKTARD